MPIFNPIPPEIQDEGVLLAYKQIINFIGAGVVASHNTDQNRVDVLIAGGAGGAHASTHIAGGSDAIATFLGSGAIPTISAGLIGLDTLNVDRIPTLSATKIGSGVLEAGRIPTLPTGWIGSGVFTLSFVPSLDSGRIPTLDASKIAAGIFAVAQIPTISANLIGSDVLQVARIPTISAALIGSDRFGMARLPDGTVNKYLMALGAGLDPTYGDAPAAGLHQQTHLAGASDAIASYLSSNAIPTLSATRIGIDTFEIGRIPTLSTALIGTGVFTLSFVPSLDTGRIPTLDTSKISTGVFAVGRIPTLTTNYIGSGVFTLSFIPTLSTGLIPTMDASKIAAGVFDTSKIPTNTRLQGINFVLDGGGTLVGSGSWGYCEIPYACTILKSELLADAIGSIMVNIGKNTYTNFPTRSIIGTIPLANVQKNQDTTLTGWTTAIAARDILEAYVIAQASGVNKITLALEVLKT